MASKLVHGSAVILLGLSLEACGINLNARQEARTPAIVPAANANNEVAKLLTASIPFEQKAEQYARWMETGDYESLEKDLTTHIQAKPLTRGGYLYVLSSLRTAFSGPQNELYLATFERWIKAKPDSSLAYSLRGWYYGDAAIIARGTRYISRTPPEQLAKFQELIALSAEDTYLALELDNENPIALFRGMNIARLTGQSLDSFDRFYTQAIAVVPHMVEAHQERLNYLLPQWGGSEAELLAFAREIYEQSPRGTAAAMILGKAHEELCTQYPDRSEYYNRPEVWADIEKSYLQVIEDFPEAKAFPGWFASVAFEAKRFDIAKQYFQVALDRDPTYAFAQLGVAKSATQLGDYEIAEQIFEQYLTAFPDSEEAYSHRALMYTAMEQRLKAIADYDRVLDLNPNQAGAYVQRGYLRGQLGDYELAKADISHGATLYDRQGATSVARELRAFLASLPY